MWGFKENKWRLLVDNPDIISYESEKENKGMRIRIEARKNEENSWTIFKTYLDDASFTYTEEYNTQTRDEAEKIISSLQKNRFLTKKEVYAHKLQLAKRFPIKLKRHFKDYNVEKWLFAIGDDGYENVVYIRDAEVIEVNIIMHEKYRPAEANTIHELKAILGLDSNDLDIKQELYYYTTKAEKYHKNKRFGLYLGNFEMGFDMANEEK